MTNPLATPQTRELISRVRDLMATSARKLSHSLTSDVPLGQLLPGKMLRTRLACRLAAGNAQAPGERTLGLICAAVEMVHTASLCHDDVIDCALLRRALPTLWRDVGVTGAVLIGDLLLSDAVQLIMEAEDGRYLGAFIKKVREVCLAEAEHELKWRGQRLDEETCLRLARSKTGSLFAFVAQVCAGEDVRLSEALEEAGYRVGTAYQLADDLLDTTGEEQLAGKTLGSDGKRQKFTLAQCEGESRRMIRTHVGELYATALECVRPWSSVREALSDYLDEELQPLLDGYTGASEDATESPR